MNESLPSKPENNNLTAKRLLEELSLTKEEYKLGKGNLSLQTDILNKIQRLVFEKLQREGEITYKGEYQSYASSAIGNEDEDYSIYSQLGVEHPVIQKQEEIKEFNHWKLNLSAAYPEVNFPLIGTKSDLFKIVLRYLCTRFGLNVSHTIISTIQLSYLQKAEISEDEFIAAHNMIVESIIEG